MKTLSIFCLAAITLTAQIRTPLAGIVRDSAGALRPVLGVSGAFVTGESIASGVICAAFSGKQGLAKTTSELLVFDASGVLERHQAPAGPAHFEFDVAGRPARVWFPESSTLWTWTADGIERALISGVPELKVLTRKQESGLLSARTGAGTETPDGPVEQMSENWVVIHSPQGEFAVCVDAGREQIVQLPGAPDLE